MSDDKREGREGAEREDRTSAEGEQELTFEHGYGAQERVLSEEEDLADVAGVKEEDVREDFLAARHGDEDDKSEKDES